MILQTIVLTIKSISKITQLVIVTVAFGFFAMQADGADWKEIQKQKTEYLTLSARHAMEQQKTNETPPVSISLDEKVSAEGELKLTIKKRGSISIDVKAAPKARGTEAKELVRIKLDKPMDLFTGYSGIAVIVKSEAGTSPEVRVGMRFLNVDGKKTNVQPIIPVLNTWGNVTHELYFDWAFLDFDKEEDVIAVLKSVNTIEITFGSVRRAPQQGPSEESRQARLTLSNMRLVDYHKGSYDPSRQSLKFDTTSGKWIPSDQYDLTLQHRTQEVTGIVATFGGDAGLKSAIEALDMTVRTQCWDGSFLDTRRGAITVASGEYTFGFTLYGLLGGYLHLEKIKHPQLDAKLTIGSDTMTRREFYQRMFYRGAMARTAAIPSAYRDDIIEGNTLITGANRVLGYAIAMRMVADVLTNPAQKKQVLEKYAPIMQEIANAQGEFSGGFPVLGEGDRYNGRGIHYDAGYTRTHMDWLVIGARQTGDPLLVEILRKYQTVFEAAMDEQGLGILSMISERGHGNGSVQLVIPDATFQVGAKYKLPIIAQWGYNCSQFAWSDTGKTRNNHFVSAATTRGYRLGAHMSRLMDDMRVLPVPKDLGYIFPRQFPLWSTQTYSKDRQLIRTSVMVFHPDGTQISNYRIEVGEYPVTVGIPVTIKSARKVTAVANKLLGWPKLLPEGAEIEISGGISIKGKVDKPIVITLEKETQIVITGPNIILPPEANGESIPFYAELTLMPEQTGQTVELTVLRGTVPYHYKLEKAEQNK